MKLLWLCNILPGEVKREVTGKPGSGLWMDHVLSDLRNMTEMHIRILCPSPVAAEGQLDAACSYATFQPRLPHEYVPELENRFRAELRSFQPDVIHIWGTEYAHTLSMVNAAEAEGMLDHLAVSIQGLCSFIAGHYLEGIPAKVCSGFTFRDFVRQDNLRQQQRIFVRRGQLEQQALQKVRHVIGRTHWDRACTMQIHPGCQYHTCRETLRQEFYTGQWQYENCRKHTIFAPGCSYPVKGFHHMLEAFALVKKAYPDAVLTLPGDSVLQVSPIRENSYQRYLKQLICRHGLKDSVHFLGKLSADGMKQACLGANVFAMPSTIENSPNALAEAMLLGVPCVAADVGGVTTMLTHEKEGFVYQSTAPYLLAYFICRFFAMEDAAQALGQAAREHARITHDPEQNLQDLLTIYKTLA